MAYRYRPGKSRETTLRKRMITKHGKGCMQCGYPGYFELHHIKRVADGGEHREENVLLLCEKCHADAHGWSKRKYLDKSRQGWMRN